MPRGEGGRDRIREREAKVDLKKGWTTEYEQGNFRYRWFSRQRSERLLLAEHERENRMLLFLSFRLVCHFTSTSQ